MKKRNNETPKFTLAFLRQEKKSWYIPTSDDRNIPPVFTPTQKPKENFRDVMDKVPRNMPVQKQNFQNQLHEVPIPSVGRLPPIPVPKKPDYTVGQKLHIKFYRPGTNPKPWEYPEAPQEFLRPSKVG